MSTSDSVFEIRGDMIKLGQLLKAIGLIDSGAQVKDLLEAAEIEVNGEIEVRRGRKIHPGDTVRLPDHTIVAIVSKN